MNYLDVDSNHFNAVRKILIEEGIVQSPSNGYLCQWNEKGEENEYNKKKKQN